MIVYPLNTPTVTLPARIAMRARTVVGLAESPFTLEQQVYEHQGERWEADVQLPPMTRAQASEWVAMLLALRGRRGTFLMGDYAATSPRGTAGGTPLVKGASQTGKSLITDGRTAGATFLRGDYFQLGTAGSSRLHQAIADAAADGVGNMTIDIFPRLRESPADNAALTLASPKGLFRLASNEVGWSVDEAQFYGLAFSAVEAL